MEKQIRCAIYTRKSCEDKIKKEFSSIEAQRLSGENYAASQGWEIIEEKYDDNGFSGGNIQRPGLKKLLRDIEKGKIDCVIAYKVDRLSRSLLDFERIMNKFDKYKVTFSAITEPFNTRTLVGRLILDIILSFAQYERKLIGERIRDKIAASKAKGMWMGGSVLLGYEIKEKKLEINEKEAKLIKYIFESFVKIKSIFEVTRRLNEKGYKTKGGKEFERAAVKRILENVTYRGLLRNKETIYEGQHKAIIDKKLWEKAKENLSTRERSQRENVTEAVLKGILRCHKCNAAMQPYYTRSGNKEYRYYVCGKHVTGRECKAENSKIAAGEIESIMIEQIPKILMKQELVEQGIRRGKKVALEILGKISESWENIFPVEQKKIIELLIRTIWLKEDGADIEINDLKEVLERYNESSISIEVKEEEITIPMKFEMKKHKGRSVIILPEGEERENRDDKLLKALVRAHLWRSQIDKGEYANARELREAYGISSSKYAGQILRLNLLAPKIREDILRGKQPKHLRLSDFMNGKMELLWSRQIEQFYGTAKVANG